MPYRSEPSTAARGRAGEDAAARVVAAAGLEVLERNFRTPRGEVDIIARDGTTICFIEVKSWRRGLWADADRGVGPLKRGRIRSTAQCWLQRHPDRAQCGIRFDLFLLDPAGGGHEWLAGALDY